jgi:class 3 adenylate cyclase
MSTHSKALGDRPGGGHRNGAAPRIVWLRPFKVIVQLPLTCGRRRCSPSDSSTTSLATSPLALEGERKRATVLDCRIANAAAVVERLGPAAARDLTRDLLKMAAEELGRYGGVITERRADGFVALFGAPVVHEDDARRAVLAALGIQHALDGLRRWNRIKTAAQSESASAPAGWW